MLTRERGAPKPDMFSDHHNTMLIPVSFYVKFCSVVPALASAGHLASTKPSRLYKNVDFFILSLGRLVRPTSGSIARLHE